MLFKYKGHIFNFFLATVPSLMFFCLGMSKIVKDGEVEEAPGLKGMKIEKVYNIKKLWVRSMKHLPLSTQYSIRNSGPTQLQA